jgi:hypothetical protein
VCGCGTACPHPLASAANPLADHLLRNEFGTEELDLVEY